MAKVTITKEGMIRTGEYINKLRKAQQDGIIDENAHIPTAIRCQDYEIFEFE